jgi:hypothetical protein
MMKCGVLFEVRTEFLNNIYTGFGFKWLSNVAVDSLFRNHKNSFLTCVAILITATIALLLAYLRFEDARISK